MTEPIVVAILHPPGFTTEIVERFAVGCSRPIEVLLDAHYREPHDLKNNRERHVPPEQLAHLLPEIDDATRDALARAEALLAIDLPNEVVDLAPNLRYVQTVGAGLQHVDLKYLFAKGIRVANGSGIQAGPIAEFVIARLLQVWKILRRYEENQQVQNWQRERGRLFAGSTIGIVGLGAIGTAVARLAQSFDTTVIATRRSYVTGMTAPNVDDLLPADSLDELLERSDAIVLSVPSTPETTNMIGEREFSLMKPGAVLCNVARGGLVDDQALIAALESGHLGAAILDVTREEPLPESSPLWKAPNIYVSPHSAGTDDGWVNRLAKLLGANLVRYATGEALINERDPKAGY